MTAPSAVAAQEGNMHRYFLAAIAAFGMASGAQAVKIPAGTASFAYLFNPTISYAANNGIYNGSGSIFTTSSSGGYTGSNGAGSTSGSLTFSLNAGSTVSALAPMVLTFGNFTFTASSISTISYTANGGDTAISLYLLGTTSANGFDATNSSVTLQLNRTGGSAFSASATLSNPPSSAVPEPASWAMMLGGFGVIGSVMRSRRRVSLTFS